MKKYYYLLFFLIYLASINVAHAQKEVTSVPFTIGESITMKSSVLNEDRILNVYLPHGYSPDSAHVYPVIYLLDGSADEDFIHVAGLVQFGSFSWINLMPESIVVGIANVDRKRDFTFHTDVKSLKKNHPTTGHSAPFIEFIEKELIPLIHDRYHTNDVSTLIGQSLGGLLASEILYKKPDMFTNYIIVSPSLWWDEGSLLEQPLKPIKPTTSVFVAVGNEGDIMVSTAAQLITKLRIDNLKKENLYFQYFEQHDHGDVLHQALYNAFEILFKSEKQE